MFPIGALREQSFLPDPSTSRQPAMEESASGLPAAWQRHRRQRGSPQPDPFASLDGGGDGEAGSEPRGALPGETAGGFRLIIGAGPSGGGPAADPDPELEVLPGGGDPAGETCASEPGEEEAAGLVLDAATARRLAEDLVQAVAATYPARVARARADGQWSIHLGDVIRDAHEDFRRVVAPEVIDRDALFVEVLEQVLSGDAPGDDAGPGSGAHAAG